MTDRLADAIAQIDAANAQDPNTIDVDGQAVGAELIYGQRMSQVLNELYPDASDVLKAAARAQHLQRWTMPRDGYPMDRAGYHRWRNDCKRRHAELAGDILKQSGFSDDEIERARALIAKKNLKSDGQAQALEDVACIVFLRYYADDFAAKHTDEKMVRILAKTWAKMSERAHAAALAMTHSQRLKTLIETALSADA